MAKLSSVEKTIESKAYPGVFFRDVSFAELEEFRKKAGAIDPDDLQRAEAGEASDALMETTYDLVGWMFVKVLRAEDGTPFEDAVEDPKIAGVVMSSRLIREFSELSSGN